MMGHLLHILEGKEDTAFRGGSSAVLRWDALGLLHLRLFFFGGGFVLSCGAPHDLFIKCMPVRVIQPILYRN